MCDEYMVVLVDGFDSNVYCICNMKPIHFALNNYWKPKNKGNDLMIIGFGTMQLLFSWT